MITGARSYGKEEYNNDRDKEHRHDYQYSVGIHGYDQSTLAQINKRVAETQHFSIGLEK